MTHDLRILDSIRRDLIQFSSPGNLEAFFVDFCEWVIKEWESRAYFHIENESTGHGLCDVCYRTDLMLKDKVTTYQGFLGANNGHPYIASVGTLGQTMEKRLYDFFHESMRLRALAWLEDKHPAIDADDFWNRIFCDDFTHPAEIRVAQDIADLFGFYGFALRPYLCPPRPRADEGRYANWSLADFKTAIGLIRGLGSERLGKVAMAAGKLFIVHKGGQDNGPIKKSLSQNGAIA